MNANEDAILRMTLAQMMAARDGEARVWIDEQSRFAKIVRDGSTIARIDRHVDGSFSGAADGKRITFQSWDAASAWLTARATAEALVSPIWVPDSRYAWLRVRGAR